jgi:hypothetical protein
MGEYSKEVTDEKTLDGRIKNEYYRVGLYGSKFGNENGHEYIVKMGDFKKLPDVKDSLIKLYKNKLKV